MKMEFSVEYCFEGIKEFKTLYGDYNTIKKFEERVIKLGIPKLSYLFMKNIEGSNKKAHTKIILSSSDPKLIYETAKIKGVNVLELGKSIINSKDVNYNYLFARDIDGSLVKSHEDLVVSSNEDLIKYHFAKDVKDSDKRRIGESVLNGNPSINFFFARDIKDGLFAKHMEVVKSNKELYDRLVSLHQIKSEEDLEKQRAMMCKDARRVLRRLDYIVEK